MWGAKRRGWRPPLVPGGVRMSQAGALGAADLVEGESSRSGRALGSLRSAGSAI